MAHKWYASIVLFLLLGLVNVSYGVGPRDPLSFKNVGLYGGWNDYFVASDSPFDFLIVQANVVDGKILWHGHPLWNAKESVTGPQETSRSWNEWLKIARANGKRVIADLGASVTVDGKEHSFQGSWNEEKPVPIEQFFPMFDTFFREVDEEEIYAITIGEEHVFWNGQQERVLAVHDYLKNKYKVPFYHWWSPSNAGSTVGLTWPNLPGDGWMLDEYFLQQPNIETSLRAHTMLQKPVFQIIWAAPDMPSVPWNERTFWDQYAACRKYNVPIAFFCWSGKDKSPSSDTWGWEPKASAKARAVFEDFCIYGVELARRIPSVPMTEWDCAPYAQKQIKLVEDEAAKGTAVYKETFAKERGLAVLLDASFTGFANLKWDSSPLQLKPRAAGDAELTIRYCFDSPKKTQRIAVNAVGKTQAGTVEIRIADLQGKVLAEGKMTDGSAAVELDAARQNDTRFVVLVRMKGNARQAGEVLAELASISVTCELGK